MTDQMVPLPGVPDVDGGGGLEMWRDFDTVIIKGDARLDLEGLQVLGDSITAGKAGILDYRARHADAGDDDGPVMNIPSCGGGFLRVGHRRGRVQIAGHEIEIAAAADLEIAVDEAVARARAWADGQADGD